MEPLAGVSAIAAASAVAGARDPRTQAAELLSAAPTGSETHALLSPAGQLLEALLSDSGAQTTAAPPSPLLPSAPSGPGPALILARALQDGFSTSGLFYEAHLADWVRGDATLAQILNEPQAQLPPLPQPGAAIAADPRASNAGIMANAAANTGHGDPVGAPTAWQHQVDPKAAGLVQQQLLALDTQVLPWQGEVWPGQPARWSVRPDQDADHAPGDASASAVPRAWISTLRIALPGLGQIDAELRLHADRCSLELQGDPEQLIRLRQALPALAQALADAGLQAGRLRISPSSDQNHD